MVLAHEILVHVKVALELTADCVFVVLAYVDVANQALFFPRLEYFSMFRSDFLIIFSQALGRFNI